MSALDVSLSERLSQYKQHIKPPTLAVAGILTRVVGLTLEAKGLRAPVGSQCKIETMNGFVDAEIVPNPETDAVPTLPSTILSLPKNR